MIEEIDLLSDDEPEKNADLGTPAQPAPASAASSDFMGSQAPLDLDIGLDIPEEVSLLSEPVDGRATDAAAAADLAGNQGALDLEEGGPSLSLVLEKPGAVTAPTIPAKDEPIPETEVPVAEPVAVETQKRRSTRRGTSQQLIMAKERPAKGQVIKGTLKTAPLVLIILAVGFVGFLTGGNISLAGRSLEIIHGQANIQTAVDGVKIKSLVGEPIRLFGGQELLLLKGELAGNVEKWAQFNVEAIIYDKAMKEPLVSGKVQVGTKYNNRDLQAICRRNQWPEKPASTGDNHFQIVIPAKAVPDTLLALKSHPQRLVIKVSK